MRVIVQTDDGMELLNEADLAGTVHEALASVSGRIQTGMIYARSTNGSLMTNRPKRAAEPFCPDHGCPCQS